MATDEPTNDEGLASTPQSAGSHLRAAREAAGLSLDQVAQQLKLAPRQVRALEDEAFDELPGRTFTRGFVRNYARLLGLDAATLIALLPDAAHAPSLESPPLQSTLARMGELPSAQRRPASFGRWLIPLILVACVVAAAAYEWYRGKPGRADVTPSAQTEAPAPASSATSVPLPNPVTDKNPGEGTPAADANLPVTAPAPAAQPTTTPAPAAPVSANPASAPSTMTHGAECQQGGETGRRRCRASDARTFVHCTTWRRQVRRLAQRRPMNARPRAHSISATATAHGPKSGIVAGAY